MSFLTQQCNEIRWDEGLDAIVVTAAGLETPTVTDRDAVNEVAWNTLVEGKSAFVPVGNSTAFETAMASARSELSTRWSQVESAVGVLDGMAGSSWDVALVATPVAWALKPLAFDTSGRSVVVVKGAPNGVAMLVSRV